LEMLNASFEGVGQKKKRQGERRTSVE